MRLKLTCLAVVFALLSVASATGENKANGTTSVDATTIGSTSSGRTKGPSNKRSLNASDTEPRQSWGFVPVRPAANIFWWLHYAEPNDEFKKYPLVIWLQGGPGASSTGFGNFGEIGPFDTSLHPRNNSWLKYANLLFIDNPVGAGYSYTTSRDAFVRNNTQIAEDLLVCLTSVIKAIPDLKTLPLYIFSESYGGKMTATFARHLNDAIVNGSIVANLKGIALGDSWISPLDSTQSWADYLYATSLIDSKQKQELDLFSKKIRNALKSGNGTYATQLWSLMENKVSEQTNGVDWYNILKDDSNKLTYKKWFIKNRNHRMINQRNIRSHFLHVNYFNEDNDLDRLMNGEVRKKLGIPPEVTWGGQSNDVFEILAEDFMKPVIDDVDYLLNSTDVKVTVYTGQLDLIVNTLGTETWLTRLTWPGIRKFLGTAKVPFAGTHGNPKAFVKKQGNLSFYWILQAGHMIPSDQLDVSVAMLRDVIAQ